MGKPRKNVQRQKARTTGPANNLWRMWNDPETRPIMEARAALAHSRAGRPPGVADGHTKKQTAVLRAKAEQEAERIIGLMAKKDDDISLVDPDEIARAGEEAERIVDDEKLAARRALKEAITIALMPGARDRQLSAIRTVLEYTKAKPASTTNTNINPAEAFLEALAKKE